MNLNQFLRVSFFLLFSVAVILALVFNNAKSIRKEDVIERASVASIAAELLKNASTSATPKTIFVYPTSTPQPEIRVEKTERVETHEKETVREAPAQTSTPQPTQSPAPTPTPRQDLVCVLNVCL